ncbi:acyl-CoA thioesterase [Aureimonas frigidaquae]|uniref:acyl-CoA thioesterase n=1 Tax=Aureimonas frigidaquae TaxID=424757 RepID=UPI0007845931|nr:thioesterase family protein [Aureimonas frigidaquae]
MPEHPRPDKSRYAAFIDVPTRWSDNDAYGHLNNSVYYALFDTAVTRFLFSLSDQIPKPLPILFVAETSCRYLAEAAYPDALSVGIRIERLGTSSIAYELAVFRQDDPLAVAQGRFVHVHIDAATRRPHPLPAALRTLLEPYCDA